MGVQSLLSQLQVMKVLGWRSVLQANRLKHLSEEIIRGFYVTRAIIALFNIGFFDELAEGQAVNLETFATQKRLDLRVLRILCDYLFSLKILKRDGKNYGLDAKGSTLVKSLSGAFHMVYAYEDIFYHLESLLTQDKKYGVDITRRSEFVAKGSGAVGKLLAFPMVQDVLSRRKFECILDLGCGDATFLIDLCERNERAQGYGLDISPEAIAAGKRNVERKNFQDRVQLFVGDIFRIEALAGRLSGVQAATSMYVLHEFLCDDNARILELLQGFRNSLPGIPLVLCEVIRHTPEELRRKPGGVLEIQLFHGLSNQRLASRAEWQALFRQAGFTDVQEDYLDFVRTAIYVVS